MRTILLILVLAVSLETAHAQQRAARAYRGPVTLLPMPKRAAEVKPQLVVPLADFQPSFSFSVFS